MVKKGSRYSGEGLNLGQCGIGRTFFLELKQQLGLTINRTSAIFMGLFI